MSEISRKNDGPTTVWPELAYQKTGQKPTGLWKFVCRVGNTTTQSFSLLTKGISKIGDFFKEQVQKISNQQKTNKTPLAEDLKKEEGEVIKQEINNLPLADAYAKGTGLTLNKPQSSSAASQAQAKNEKIRSLEEDLNILDGLKKLTKIKDESDLGVRKINNVFEKIGKLQKIENLKEYEAVFDALCLIPGFLKEGFNAESFEKTHVEPSWLVKEIAQVREGFKKEGGTYDYKGIAKTVMQEHFTNLSLWWELGRIDGNQHIAGRWFPKTSKVKAGIQKIAQAMHGSDLLDECHGKNLYVETKL